MLKFKPTAVELTDDRILELTKDNLSQKNNRFFLDGEPGAIMMVEFARESKEEVESVTQEMINALKEAGYGYSYPIIRDKDMAKAWELERPDLEFLEK
jgi:hypothetical protein